MNKKEFYKLGLYLMPVPPVITAKWALDDWVNFVDASGQWFTFDKAVTTLNPSDKPISETHFFKWLDGNHSEGHHRMKDKRKYLESLGFVYGCDKLKIETIEALNSIHGYHFHKTLGKDC